MATAMTDSFCYVENPTIEQLEELEQVLGDSE
jgi:hypothetical protein